MRHHITAAAVCIFLSGIVLAMAWSSSTHPRRPHYSRSCPREVSRHHHQLPSTILAVADDDDENDDDENEYEGSSTGRWGGRVTTDDEGTIAAAVYGVSYIGGDPCGSKYNDDPFDVDSSNDAAGFRPGLPDDMKDRIAALVARRKMSSEAPPG